MDLLYLNEKLKGKELEKNQFNFNFIKEFVPEKVFFNGIGIKEGFPGDIYIDFLISGYIKGFEEFKINSFRRKKIFENGKNVMEILELKDDISKVFDDNEYIDLSEEGIIDEDKNLIFLNKISIFPENDFEKYKSLNVSEVLKHFILFTEKVIEKKIDIKILKFIEKSKPSDSTLKIPDELKDFVSPNGFLIEPFINKKQIEKKNRLLISI